MITARLFLRGKAVAFYSRFDPAIDWPASTCTVEEYIEDPLHHKQDLHFVDGETPTAFYFRPPALEDAGALESTLGAVAKLEEAMTPKSASLVDADRDDLERQRATLLRHAAETLCERCFVRVEGVTLPEDVPIVEALGVVAEEMGGYLLSLFGPGEQEKKG